MQTSLSKHFKILPGFYILLAASLLILPAPFVLGWFIASLFHEFCHFISLRAFRICIYSVNLGPTGAVIETEGLSPLQELVSAAAGPLGSLFLLIFQRKFPYLAICATVQAIFNLLPLYPLDGGRVLHCCLVLLFSKEKGTGIRNCIETIFICALLCFAVILSIYYRLGIFPMIISFLILLRCGKIKTPCKQTELIVQ